MAYYNNTPQFYPPQQFPNYPYVPTQQPQQQNNSGIIWVQGENAAKSYPVSAGQSVLLMDSENPYMYIKSTDQSGMPNPLRVFEIREKIQNGSQTNTNTQETKAEYVPKAEFDKLKDRVEEFMKQQRSNNFKKMPKED